MKSHLIAICASLVVGMAHAAPTIESFDNPVLKGWKWLHDTDGWPNQLARQDVKEGKLILEPYTSTWTGGFHAPFLYREVSGDFVATTRVKVEGLTGPNFRWKNIGSKAGLLVRKPTKAASVCGAAATGYYPTRGSPQPAPHPSGTGPPIPQSPLAILGVNLVRASRPVSRCA